MNSLRKLPNYFSMTAIFVSMMIVIIKGITPIRAICRIASSALAFYVLGFCISTILKKNTVEKPANVDKIDLDAGTQEEFEELDFPVIDAAQQDVLGGR